MPMEWLPPSPPGPSATRNLAPNKRRYGGEGIEPCWDNSLRSQYKWKLEDPKGEMDWTLVNECDNEDVPDYDYRTCDHNTYMCCWTENDGQGMADNTVRFRLPP